MSSSSSSHQQRHIIQQNHLQAWAKSGLSQLAYSKLHGIKYQTFYKWVHRSRQKNKLPAKQSPKLAQSSPQLAVVPVQITSLPAPQSRLGASLILTSLIGWQLQFQDLPSVQWL